MSKIKMIKTTPGALDGIHIRKFDQGMVYSIPDQISQSLAELFLSMGVAKVARERSVFKPKETDVVDVPEIKVEDLEPEKKNTSESDTEVKEEKKTIQIFMLSDEINVSSSEIVRTAKKLNIGVKNHMSVLSDEEVQRIKKKLNK
jgi:hypothetical protein